MTQKEISEQTKKRRARRYSIRAKAYRQGFDDALKALQAYMLEYADSLLPEFFSEGLPQNVYDMAQGAFNDTYLRHLHRLVDWLRVYRLRYVTTEIHLMTAGSYYSHVKSKAVTHTHETLALESYVHGGEVCYELALQYWRSRLYVVGPHYYLHHPARVDHVFEATQAIEKKLKPKNSEWKALRLGPEA